MSTQNSVSCIDTESWLSRIEARPCKPLQTLYPPQHVVGHIQHLEVDQPREIFQLLNLVVVQLQLLCDIISLYFFRQEISWNSLIFSIVPRAPAMLSSETHFQWF